MGLNLNSPGLVLGDARSLRRLTPQGGQFSAVVTSPPYWDLQDYGAPEQIGFGQSEESYLADIRTVFQACSEVTIDSASMWLVLGFVRRKHRVVMLPSMVVEQAFAAGWTPREWVTWEKRKSLPYTKHGELRDVTEHAVLLSKSDDYRFNLDDLLDPVPSSEWWVRYPERYSPAGRRPTNLWSIPIPTQGSWKTGPDHACPFPHELTFRMLSMVTAPGDSVLDPFAGVGSVPAMAQAMGRTGLGLDIRPEYVASYDTTVRAATEWWEHKSRELAEAASRSEVFRETILELRLLKFARILGAGLRRHLPGLVWVEVSRLAGPPTGQYAEVGAVFHLGATLGPGRNVDGILATARGIASKRPLSKFGIQAEFVVVDPCEVRRGEVWYREGRFWTDPVAEFPGNSDEPHVVASFTPRISEVKAWA